MAKCNVYNDFSHFYAVPIKKRDPGKPREVKPKTDFDIVFDAMYDHYVNQGLKNDSKGRADLYKRLCFDLFRVYGFGTEYSSIKEKVQIKLDNKNKAEIRRQIHYIRKSAMFRSFWTHFITITNKGLDDDLFEQRVREYNSRMTCRFGWVIAGKFERGEENGRLHFHALARIVPGTSFSHIEEKHEYNPLKRKMETRHANVDLDDKFGRTDFIPIDQFELMYGNVAQYVSKYTNKSEGKTYYSKGIPSGFTMDVKDDDVACEKVTTLTYIDKKTEEEKKLEKIRYVLYDSRFKKSEDDAFDVNIFALKRDIEAVS